MRRLLPLVLLALLWGQVVTEMDKDLKMCGMWNHSTSLRNLNYDLKTGCEAIQISANESTLTLRGQITAQCHKSDSLILPPSPEPSHFCVSWEPLLDLLTVTVAGQKITVCDSQGVQNKCCTHLSAGFQRKAQRYGIVNGTIHGDLITHDVIAEYEFRGDWINCKEEFCDKATQEARGANMIEETVMRSKIVGNVDLPCAKSTVIEMDEGFAGYNLSLDERAHPDYPVVHLPTSLKTHKMKKAKVVCTFYKNSSMFQGSAMVLDNVIGISVENEIIRNLEEPLRIRFHHSDILENQTATCVSWDTRKDNEIKWREEGCKTVHISSKETECCCNHLTYFAILVQVNPTKTLRHLQALTYITAVGCAVSIVSCVVLFISLCRKRRTEDRTKSTLVHRGLVVALFFLCLFFVLTGTIANLELAGVCHLMGALLHYALLSTLCWMAVEVIHTFWMISMVFREPPKLWIWYLLGFGFPVLPVIILASIGDIYGQRVILPSDVISKPYRMCWMKESHAALLAHFILNVGILAMVVSSGCIMLFLVFKKVRNREDWRKKMVTFLSIWGLSCLFGTTWALAFGSASETIVFFFCIVNSLQGFFLMLRFYALERMRKKSELCMISSSGSIKQNMLQSHEKS